MILEPSRPGPGGVLGSGEGVLFRKLPGFSIFSGDF